jgi:hypothetical protein
LTRINTATHETARLALGRLLREYQRGDIGSQAFRDLCYGMNLLLAYFRHEADVQIETRLDAIEAILTEGQG